MSTHPWRLVAPWYRWELRGVSDPARADLAGRPALHKYVTDDFMEQFLADPQSSVAFDSDDYVQRVESVPALPPLASGVNGGKKRRLTNRRLVPGDTRKLYQAAHGRFYLVSVALHCDGPGFPAVAADEVAEAGFVVRRKRAAVPAGAEADAARLLADLAASRSKALVEQELDGARTRARVLLPRAGRARRQVSSPALARAAAHQDVALARRRLTAWADTAGVTRTAEGWVPGGNGSIGSWVAVDADPAEPVERVYPMHRVPAAPNDPDHAAVGMTMWSGLVPTASDEMQADGTSRFDDVEVYEIRCFVRRAPVGDCPGELVWSEPSEPFRLAAFFDPIGSAQRPVAIKLPDLPALEAAAVAPAVRMSTPPGSSLSFAKGTVPPTSGSVDPNAPEEICFFAIPLITIVAMFVLNIFLPILLLVFNLWWMLKLKFCIPPSIALSADLSAELSVVPGGISAAASFDIDVDLAVGVDQGALRDVMRDALDAQEPEMALGTTLTATYTNDAVVTALASQGYGSETGGVPVYPLSLPTDTRVTREEVVHP